MLDYQKIAMCLCFLYVFIEKCSCDADEKATDGNLFLQKYLKGEALSTPSLLVFTAPSKLCKPGKNETCKGKRLAFSFPLIIGKEAPNQFPNYFPRKVPTVNPVERPTFTTTIRYCLEGRRCLQNDRRRGTPLQLLSTVIRARRSILDHPESFLDTVTKSQQTTLKLSTDEPQQIKDFLRERKVSTITPITSTQLEQRFNVTSPKQYGKLIIELLKNSSKFVPRAHASRRTTKISKYNNKNASRIEPYKGITSMKKHSKWLKKVTDLFGYQNVEPYKHLEYPQNKTKKKLSLKYKKNIKRYLAKLERNRHNNKTLFGTGDKSRFRAIKKEFSEYPPIKGIKVNDRVSDYDEHHIRNSAELSKENFEEMSLPDPETNISDQEKFGVKRIQKEKVLVEPGKLKRFKIKDNNNNDVKTGNSIEDDLDSKPLIGDSNKKKKEFNDKKITYLSKETEDPVTQKPQVSTSTNKYKPYTLSYIKQNDYKKTSIPTKYKPYRDSTKQTTDFSAITIVTRTPYSTKKNKKTKTDSSREDLKKPKGKINTVLERNKIIPTMKPYKESPRDPYIQTIVRSESTEDSDASDVDPLRFNPLLGLLNPSSSEADHSKKLGGSVSDKAKNKLSSSSVSAEESESSQSHEKVSYTSGSALYTKKNKPGLKQRPQKVSSSESSEITDISVDVPNTSSKNRKPNSTNKTKLRSKIRHPIAKLSDIPPNDHNKYIPYLHKLMKVQNTQSPIESTQSVNAETQTESVPKKVLDSGTETEVQENSDNDNDKIAEILRDLLRESRNSLDAPDIVRLPNEIKIRKSKLTTKRSRNKHPEVYIMVV